MSNNKLDEKPEETSQPRASIDRYLERRTQQPDDEQVLQERLEFISPSSINLERGSQTRVAKNKKGIKDILEKMEAGLWRFDDPSDCPELVELTEDYLVRLEDQEPFWVRAGELIPAVGHTRLEAGQCLQELRTDIKMLVRITPGTWFDVIKKSGMSDVKSAQPKSADDRIYAARRFIQLLFEKYGSLDAIPRRGRGRTGADLEIEYGNKTLGEMFGVSYKTIERIYADTNFNWTLSNYPNGTRVQLVANENDPTLPWYLKPKIGALGVVAEPVPVEGLLIKFDAFSPECVPIKFLALSDAPLPETPFSGPSITIPGRGSSSNQLTQQARSLGVQTGSQAIPSSPTNLDIPPEEVSAEPPTPSPIPTAENTENKSEESTPLEQITSNTTDTTADTWVPEIDEWVLIGEEAPEYQGKKAQIKCFPHSYSKDLVIVAVEGETARSRIETKFLKPVETSHTISTEDIITEITIGVRQLSPEELSQVLVGAQPTESHKKAIKSALFKDKDADLVEAARTVVNNIGRYTPKELEAIERAIASVKSAIAN